MSDCPQLNKQTASDFRENTTFSACHNKVNFQHWVIDGRPTFFVDGAEVSAVQYDAEKASLYGQMHNVAHMGREKGVW